MKTPTLQSFQLRNFKSVRDSGMIKLTPLTVLIGNNGSGKSSLVEGLETLQAIVDQGLDRAMQQWRGFEYIWHQHSIQGLRSDSSPRSGDGPMGFELHGRIDEGRFTTAMQISPGIGENELRIQHERIKVAGKYTFERDTNGAVHRHYVDKQVQEAQTTPQHNLHNGATLGYGESLLTGSIKSFIEAWQFIALVPQAMGAPTPQTRTSRTIRLAKDGSNIAEYLLAIRRIDPAAYTGIIETLQAILPYANDLQPMLTSELERTVYLQLHEVGFTVPGWLLSTGTLHILALLALLRHPTPPPLIVIEEIENGLDPRTIHLIVDEIRRVVESNKTQIIITTHSPYLLDLLDVTQLVLVERVDGQPTFIRPADDTALQEWTSRFGPGQLYTMDRLGRART